jgi:hypothetical protein
MRELTSNELTHVYGAGNYCNPVPTCKKEHGGSKSKGKSNSCDRHASKSKSRDHSKNCA